MIVRHRRPRKPPRGSSRGQSRAPACIHYPDCFGCDFIDRPYPQQLARKHQLISEALALQPSLDGLKLPPVIPSPRRLRYRARVKLVVRQAGDRILIGLYVPQTHRVGDMSSCPVHPEPVNAVARFLKNRLTALGIVPYDPKSDTGQLRYLDFRYSFWRKEILLTLVTRRRLFPQGQRLARLLMRHFPFIAGIVQNVNEDLGNVIWGKNFVLLTGRDSVMERIGFLKLRYPAGAFSQANPAVAVKIYDSILKLAALSGQETALDVYCGVGPISLYLASAARLVWGIDESSLAIATAKQNARLNGFGNCRFFASDAAEKMNEAGLALRPVHVVAVNPPRKGIRPDVLASLLSLQAPTVIYVSCNPVTLARDLNRLAAAGYQPHSIQAFDMFPQTPEVETVALLKKRN